jgi:hypothetical protein
MKIISKFKDYYDHIAGLYGIDDKIVYVRNYQAIVRDDYRKGVYHKVGFENCLLPTNIKTYSETPDVDVFSICNTFYVRVLCGNDIYWGSEALVLEKYLSKWQSKSDFKKTIALHGQKNELNTKEFPIAITSTENDIRRVFTRNPRLSDYGFASILPPNDLFLMLSTFLSQEKEVVDTRTNIEKVLSNGFDKISSFRKM